MGLGGIFKGPSNIDSALKVFVSMTDGFIEIIMTAELMDFVSQKLIVKETLSLVILMSSNIVRQIFHLSSASYAVVLLKLFKHYSINKRDIVDIDNLGMAFKELSGEGFERLKDEVSYRFCYLADKKEPCDYVSEGGYYLSGLYGIMDVQLAAEEASKVLFEWVKTLISSYETH